MDLSAKMTVAALTPPGYFNLASDAPATHKAFITWWNAILAGRAAQAQALRALILTPWLVDHLDSPGHRGWIIYLGFTDSAFSAGQIIRRRRCINLFQAAGTAAR